ncbi:MAG TPA: carbohydrate kinase family protein [Candidatus Peribacterales bacterium]|nr:carbohydrate kinase family protein [Candidatus Peribacterales bacterium]
MRASHETDVDITSIGGAAFDVFVRAPHDTVSENGGRFIQFPLGAKIKIENVVQCCGGGATNTSVGFSRLDLSARFCGVIGDDEWGKEIQETLMKEGVSADTAIIVEGEISSFSIILVDTSTGDRTILYSANVNSHLGKPVLPKEKLRQSRWLFLNHLSDVSSVIMEDMCDLACDDNVKLAWNPGGSQIRNGFDAPLEKNVLSHTDILFLNAEEAMAFTRVASIEGALRVGIRAGVKIMCVSDGSRGAFMSDGFSILSAKPSANAVVVDTTGAGDAFAVGVTWAVLRSLPLQTALSAGMINAESVIGAIGTQAGLLTEHELRTRLSSAPLAVSVSPF